MGFGGTTPPQSPPNLIDTLAMARVGPFAVLFLTVLISKALALNNGVGKLPAMGYNGMPTPPASLRHVDPNT